MNLFGLLLLGICAVDGHSVPQESPFFPIIEGYTLRQDEPVYTSENLWELIDGAADLFVGYDLQDMRAAEYWSEDSLDVRVELYRYSRVADAFGVYSQERDTGFAFIQVGTQAYLEDGLLNFLCGLYYVKVSTHRSGESGKRAMQSVAKEIVLHLRQPLAWPRMLQVFPLEGRIANSETYVRENFLGYSFLRSAFAVRYSGATEAQAFVLDGGSAEGSEGMLQKYLRLVSAGQATVASATIDVLDPNLGKVALVRRGRYLGGVVGASDDAIRRELLDRLGANLTAFGEDP